MIIPTNICGGYRKGLERTWNFSRFKDQAPDFIFLKGIITRPDFLIDGYGGQKVVHLNIEEPNGFFSPGLTSYKFEHVLSKVFTVCPFTTEWYNKKQGSEKRTAVFYPFNEELVPPITKKTIDVIYVGNAVSDEIDRVLADMRNFDYRNISLNPNPSTTHCDITYKEKLELISKSKIAVVHNILFPRISHLKCAEKHWPGILSENGAFEQNALGEKSIVPQLKTRTFESAFCRSLILCRKDPWNVIENFFEPNKEFVYYDPGNLKSKIREILDNYDSYLPIIENAYKRAVNNYTTKCFFDKYLRDLFIEDAGSGC